MLFVNPTINRTDYKDMIQTYIHLDKKIYKIKARKREIKERFKAFNFVHSPMAYDDDGISWRRYPSFDVIVNEYVDACAATDQILKIMLKKQQLFKPFWDSLSERQRYLLINNLDSRLVDSAIEKIRVIEKQFPLQYRF